MECVLSGYNNTLRKMIMCLICCMNHHCLVLLIDYFSKNVDKLLLNYPL